MAHHKNKSFIRRLVSLNFRPEQETHICRPTQGSPGPFFRYRREGGILVPIDNFPFDTWESCMGMSADEDDQGTS